MERVSVDHTTADNLGIFQNVQNCNASSVIEEETNVNQSEVIDEIKQTKSKSAYQIVKRLQDILFSFIALIVLSPLFLLVALIIFIDDPKGSPIFTQIRCGKNGKPFKFYKFRSMSVDAELKLGELLSKNEMNGPAFKIKDDPRITRVGKFIRRTSIDELPQLWNILKGDMSIVGPRPSVPREVEQYTDYQRQRLSITPGLTCFWQIMPKRNSISFDEWMELDMKYIQEQSFLTDWKIIFATIRAVFQCNGV